MCAAAKIGGARLLEVKLYLLNLKCLCHYPSLSQFLKTMPGAHIFRLNIRFHGNPRVGVHEHLSLSHLSSLTKVEIDSEAMWAGGRQFCDKGRFCQRLTRCCDTPRFAPKGFCSLFVNVPLCSASTSFLYTQHQPAVRSDSSLHIEINSLIDTVEPLMQISIIWTWHRTNM